MKRSFVLLFGVALTSSLAWFANHDAERVPAGAIDLPESRRTRKSFELPDGPEGRVLPGFHRSDLLRGVLPRYLRQFPNRGIDYIFGADRAKEARIVSWDTTHFPVWRPLHGEKWTLDGRSYQLIDIGCFQTREDLDLFEPLERAVMDSRRSTRIVLGGEKLKAEMFLHSLQLKLTELALRQYALKRADRFKNRDLESMAQNFYDKGATKRIYVLIEDPPADVSQMTLEEFESKAMASFSLSDLVDVDNRVHGVPNAFTHRRLEPFPIPFREIPVSMYPNKLPDQSRPIWIDDSFQLSRKLSDANSQFHLWAGSRLVKLRDNVPRDLLLALIHKVYSQGTQADESGRPSRLLVAFDELTRKAVSRLIRGGPELYHEIQLDFSDPLEPWTSNPAMRTQEGIYYYDASNPDYPGISKTLREAYERARGTPGSGQ